MNRAPYQTDYTGNLVYNVVKDNPKIIHPKINYNELVRGVWKIDSKAECETICRSYRKDKTRLEGYIPIEEETTLFSPMKRIVQ